MQLGVGRESAVRDGTKIEVWRASLKNRDFYDVSHMACNDAEVPFSTPSNFTEMG